MYSLNTESPEEVTAIVDQFDDLLSSFERIRDDRTVLIKRFHRKSPRALEKLADDLGRRLAYWAPIQARIEGFDVFVDPPAGRGPVVYLTVRSPGLIELHRELADAYGTVIDSIEGEHYVPHITLARGGERTDIRPLTKASVEPVDWSIDELTLWDGRYSQPVRRYELS